MNKRLRLTFCTVFITASAWCYGDDSALKPALTSLTLSELMNIKVISTSKRDEPLFSAPGVVTQWNQTDIGLLGYNSLEELANITPGWFSYRNIGEITFTTRGQKASGFDNNRHLVLLDGIPVNHVRANSAPAETQLPMLVAENVEFLRGPASALYGVGAFYGVINIQSQQANEDESQSTYLNLERSNQQNDSSAYAHYLHYGDSTQVGIRVGAQQQDASAEAIDNNAAHRNYNDQQSTFAYTTLGFHKGALSGLTLGGYYSEKNGGLGNFWADYSHEENDITWRTAILYGKYKRELTNTLTLNSYLKYNTSNERASYLDESGTALSEYDYPFHNNEAQLEFSWQPTKAHGFISGFNTDSRYGEAQTVLVNNTQRQTPRTPTLKTSSAWLQYQGDFRRNKLTLGMRHDSGDYGKDNYHFTSPRIALVHNISDHFNLKFLYGEALRAPSVKEVGVNNEVVIENPGLSLAELQPETIVTYEISPYFQTDRSAVSLTLFKTETDQFLGRDWSNLGEYINISGAIQSEGYEIEVNHLLEDNIKIFANYSSSESTDKNGIKLADLPTNQFNLGVLCNRLMDKKFKGSITWRYIDGFSAAPESPDAVSGYNTLDAYLKYEIVKYSHIGLYVKNLFDAPIVMPLNSRNGVAERGQEISLTFEYSRF